MLEIDRLRELEAAIEPGRADAAGKPSLRARRGDPVRKLPDRVWRLPRQEDDEAAEERIGRILALSDGVFAIAMTLPILEIALPATRAEDVSKELLALWPRYLAYVFNVICQHQGGDYQPGQWG